MKQLETKFKEIKDIWTKKDEVTDYPSTTEQIEQLNSKANLSDVYTKT